MNTTHWGRKETIVTPPQAPIYSYAAIALTLILTIVFLRIYMGAFMPPLEHYDLWPFIQSGALTGLKPTGQYQLLDVSDDHLHAHPAASADVEPGVTTIEFARPLPLQLTRSAHAAGLVYLYRGPKTVYRNGPLHAYLQQFVYGGHSVAGVFRWPLLAGLAVLLGVLPLAARKDVDRFREMKYGRLLKGPVRVTPVGFNCAVKGDGVGFRTI